MAGEEGTATGQEADAGNGEGEQELGEKGVKALESWKSRAKAAEADAKRARELEQKLADFENANKSDHEKALEKARTEAADQARKEVLSATNEKLARSAVKAVAAGKLLDPNDALVHLDLSDFSVSDDGEIDEKQVNAAINTLLKAKPYLGVGDTRSQTGSADGGTRGRSGGVKTMDDLIRESVGIK